MRWTHSLFRLGLAVAACGTALAMAQDAPPTQAPAALGEPVQREQLDRLRGGFDLVKNDAQLGSTVTGNSALNVITGNNTIADGAFTSASGLPMVIQNTGNNVSIQNATIVNVQLH